MIGPPILSTKANLLIQVLGLPAKVRVLHQEVHTHMAETCESSYVEASPN